MTNSDTATKVASTIKGKLAEQRRNVTWLSENSGVAYKTLSRRINGAPEKFMLGELSSIARALDCELEDFFEVAV